LFFAVKNKTIQKEKCFYIANKDEFSNELLIAFHFGVSQEI
jgi:hypothetical protein